MSNYLVTGGAGFIGSHLVDYLINSGHQVTVLDSLLTGKLENVNKAAKFIHGSVTDKAALEQAFEEIDYCYHLAAIPSVQGSIDRWSKCHEVNLGGAINVFELAVSKRIPVIYASSAAVYGNPKRMPIREEDEVTPTSPYGFDKYSAEVHAKLFGDLKGLKSVGLRFFNVYGPRQDPASPYSGVISIFIQKILKNQKIQVFGDGQQIRDFIHVDDVVQALIEANNEKVLEVNSSFNVCTGRGVLINILVEILFDLFGKKVEVEYLPARTGDINQSVGYPSKLQEQVGYKAAIDIREGLKHLLAANK